MNKTISDKIKDLEQEVSNDPEIKKKLAYIRQQFESALQLATLIQPYFGKKTSEEYYNISEKLIKFLRFVKQEFIAEFILAEYAMNNSKRLLDETKNKNLRYNYIKKFYIFDSRGAFLETIKGTKKLCKYLNISECTLVSALKRGGLIRGLYVNTRNSFDYNTDLPSHTNHIDFIRDYNKYFREMLVENHFCSNYVMKDDDFSFLLIQNGKKIAESNQYGKSI